MLWTKHRNWSAARLTDRYSDSDGRVCFWSKVMENCEPCYCDTFGSSLKMNPGDFFAFSLVVFIAGRTAMGSVLLGSHLLQQP